MQKNLIPYVMEGLVVDVDDPDQMGRVKIWIASLDGENYDLANIPWAHYASPYGGFTVDYPGGTNSIQNESHTAYGFWAIPKLSATVLVFFLYGNPQNRYYFASTYRLHRNRSLPAGRNLDNTGKIGPFGDSEINGELQQLNPAFTNLREQFKNKLTEPEAQSRGVYERQVAQPKTKKDGNEGYSANAKDPSYLDSQTFCFVTPGRHALIFQDDPKNARLRVKTGEGHQIILDDANERIYVSTSKGKTWLELDQDGHIHLYGNKSINIHTEKDLNITADNDINIEAKKNINIKAGQRIAATAGADMQLHSEAKTKVSTCGELHLRSVEQFFISTDSTLHLKSDGSVNLFCRDNMNFKSISNIISKGSKIHLNGPNPTEAIQGECADQADKPIIIPEHEPWKRPNSDSPRNANWKA